MRNAYKICRKTTREETTVRLSVGRRIILKWIQKHAMDWAHSGLGQYTEAAVVYTVMCLLVSQKAGSSLISFATISFVKTTK
jgi:hypothetical protein